MCRGRVGKKIFSCLSSELCRGGKIEEKKSSKPPKKFLENNQQNVKSLINTNDTLLVELNGLVYGIKHPVPTVIFSSITSSAYI